MNINFTEWVAARKLKEATNLGSLSPAGFEDITGNEEDEASVKKPGYRYTPIDQVPAPHHDLDAQLDAQLDAEGDPKFTPWYHRSAASRMGGIHDAPYDPHNPDDNIAGVAEDDPTYYTPPPALPPASPEQAALASSPYQSAGLTGPPLRHLVRPEEPTGEFDDLQATMEQPPNTKNDRLAMMQPRLTRKEKSARLMSRLKKAKKSWKEYKRDRQAQSHVVGDPNAPTSQAQVNQMSDPGYWTRRFRTS